MFRDWQGKKVRPIDNLSEFNVNAAFGTHEKVNLNGIDQVVSWTKAWSEGVVDGEVEATRDGRVASLDHEA